MSDAQTFDTTTFDATWKAFKARASHEPLSAKHSQSPRLSRRRPAISGIVRQLLRSSAKLTHDQRATENEDTAFSCNRSSPAS